MIDDKQLARKMTNNYLVMLYKLINKDYSDFNRAVKVNKDNSLYTLYTADTEKLLGVKFDSENMFLQIFRFCSLFMNDGQINLLSKEMMTNVVNGKFCIENTDKNYLVNKYLNSTAPITKSDKFVPISIEDVDILKHLYVNKKKGKNVDIGKLQKVKQYVTYDFKTGELTSNYKNIDFEVDENDNFKIVSNEDYKVKQIIVVNSKKNPNNAGKNKYEVYHESQPLQIYEYANFFKDKKSKTVAEKVPVEMSPDLIFDYFRNANAHAANQIFNLKDYQFYYKLPNGATLNYDFGWLSCFAALFINPNYSRLYGWGSEYKALPGWEKDEMRKASLLPNNEFPIILKPVIKNPIKNFDELQKFLNERKIYRLTINDDISMANAFAVFEEINSKFVGKNIEKDGVNEFVIFNTLKKHKINNYQLVKMDFYENKNNYINGYWQKRISRIPDFFSKSLNEQMEIIDSIEDINDYNIEQTKSFSKYKFNGQIAADFIGMLDKDFLNPKNKSENVFDNFSLASFNVEQLSYYAEEYAPLVANLYIVNLLIVDMQT